MTTENSKGGMISHPAFFCLNQTSDNSRCSGLDFWGDGKEAAVVQDSKDSTLICLLLLSFTGYLSPSVDERSVLGV
jgi:hypothetical protein